MWYGTVLCECFFFSLIGWLCEEGPTAWENLLSDIYELSFSILSAQTHFVIAATSFHVRQNSGKP